MACLKEIKDPFGGDKQTKEMSKGSSQPFDVDSAKCVTMFE